jgi:hypothetical protein
MGAGELSAVGIFLDAGRGIFAARGFATNEENAHSEEEDGCGKLILFSVQTVPAYPIIFCELIRHANPSGYRRQSFLSIRNLHLPGGERGDVAEALNEVFLDDSCVSLQETKTIGRGTALDGDALDIRAVADCYEREAIGGRKLNALRPECGLESDFVMLAGEWVFIQAKAE